MNIGDRLEFLFKGYNMSDKTAYVYGLIEREYKALQVFADHFDKEGTHSNPSDITYEEWMVIVKKIARTFAFLNATVVQDWYEVDYDMTEDNPMYNMIPDPSNEVGSETMVISKIAMDKIDQYVEEGLQLFAKYCLHLWC